MGHVFITMDKSFTHTLSHRQTVPTCMHPALMTASRCANRVQLVEILCPHPTCPDSSLGGGGVC